MTGLSHKDRLSRLAACALWLLVWQAASLLLGSELLLASPLATCRRLLALVQDERFLPVMWFSFSRVAGGFLAAFALGVALGFAAHRWFWVRELAAPVVLAFKSIPVACITVLLLIWVGSREVSGICVFLMAFPALYLATVEGLDQVDQKVDELLRVFDVPPLRRFLAHVWPSLLPYLVATSKNACGMAWKAGVAAELIGTPLGSMGERIYQAKILLETADLFAWTALVVAASFACEKGFLWLLARTGPWALGAAVPRGGEAPAKVCPRGITLRDVSLGYGGTPVLAGVSFALSPGDRAVLSDASGAGKTTLLHTIAGLLPALSGKVEDLRPLSMVFQEARLVEALSAEDNVLLVGAGGRTRSEVRALLMELLPEEALARPVSELSGGQRRRVEIVRALAHPSAAVLMDESFSSLDEKLHVSAAGFICAHLDRRTLVVASHAPGDVALLGARGLSLPAKTSL